MCTQCCFGWGEDESSPLLCECKTCKRYRSTWSERAKQEQAQAVPPIGVIMPKYDTPMHRVVSDSITEDFGEVIGTQEKSGRCEFAVPPMRRAGLELQGGAALRRLCFDMDWKVAKLGAGGTLSLHGCHSRIVMRRNGAVQLMVGDPIPVVSLNLVNGVGRISMEDGTDMRCKVSPCLSLL